MVCLVPSITHNSHTRDIKGHTEIIFQSTRLLYTTPEIITTKDDDENFWK